MSVDPIKVGIVEGSIPFPVYSPYWAESTIDEVIGSLQTGKDGLKERQINERMKEFGPNQLPIKHRAVYLKFLIQFRNLFNILLILAAVLSFAVGFVSNDQSSVDMGAVILLVVLISILFSLVQEKRAERTMQAIRELVPQSTKVIREGVEKQIPVTRVVPGDTLVLEEGDRIPADARVIESYNLNVDNSSITGESDPQPRLAQGEIIQAGSDITSWKNLVFAGTTVLSGKGMAVVLATGSNTQFGRIVSLAMEIQEPASPLQMELNRTARLNFYVAIIVGFAFFLVSVLYLNMGLALGLLFMIGVMISLVPEGLQVTVTLALALSSVAMAKRNMVVKRLSAVETLGSATVICVDKTGTITEGQMTARKVWLRGELLDVSGEGYEPEGSVSSSSGPLRYSERSDLLRLSQAILINNNASLSPPTESGSRRWTAVGDPMEAALIVLANKAGADQQKITSGLDRAGQIPFDTSRKMMTTLAKDAQGNVTAFVKGASIEVLDRCVSLQWDDGIRPVSDEDRVEIIQAINTFSGQAFRVLAVAYRAVTSIEDISYPERIEAGLIFLGLVAFLDPPRAEVPDAVKRARAAGLRIIMLTGDHELTAESIALRVRIITSDAATILTGVQMSGMDDTELSLKLRSSEVVFARITADQKLRVVRLLQAAGEVVAVTGDGVNDSPALLEGDIGIAMGRSGTDVARESADMVLLDDNFASIVNSIEEGRAVFDNLKKFMLYVFTHNWAELVAFIIFILLRTPLPLTIIQILAIDLILEIPTSLSLTLDPPASDTMERPPRSRTSRIFSPSALVRTLVIGAVIGLFALMFCLNVWSQHGWTLGMGSMSDHDGYLLGTTTVFAGIIAGQLGTMLTVRSNLIALPWKGRKHNWWLAAAVLLEIGLLVAMIYVPLLQMALGTAALPWESWAMLYSVVPIIILLELFRKMLVKSRGFRFIYSQEL
ncbi:MAG: cation-transporting P-type ATPase [Methanomassiliicoccales archaeon]|jgi:magnesium-transporting ATPase (P-type)